MVFLYETRKKTLFWMLLHLSFSLFLATISLSVQAREAPTLQQDEQFLDAVQRDKDSPVELTIQDSDTFLNSISEPTAEFKAFYKMTGLRHWPFQYTLGDLGISKRPLTRPKVIILVYTSLSCMHCSALHLQTLRPLQKKYADEICIVIRDRPLDLFSLQASLLTYCQPKNTHDLQRVLFEKQTAWMPDLAEIVGLSREEAHQLIKTRLKKIAQEYGYSEKCHPYFSFELLQQAAQMMSQHEEFKKILSTPLVYLYVPQKKSKQIITYAPPKEIPLDSLEFADFEKIINAERAKLFTYANKRFK